MIGGRLYAGVSRWRNKLVGLANSPEDRSYLFVSINGAGLGHLTRCLAVARRVEALDAGASITFLTTSLAVPVVQQFGYRCYHLPPIKSARSELPTGLWNDLFSDHLGAIVSVHRPRTVVFDGTWLYRGLHSVMQSFPQTRFVWIRRGLHREGDPQVVEEHLRAFDLVVVPGELENEARQPNLAGVQQVSPVVLLDPDDLLPRAEARERLRLSESDRVAFVQLGAGNINDVSTLERDVVTALRALDFRVVTARSPIALRDLDDSGADATLTHYPNARYFRAFDVAVLAAGYNSVYEALHLGLRAAFLPNRETRADDQVKRARMCSQLRGWTALEPWSSARLRSWIREAMEESTDQVPLFDGARATADLLARRG